MKKNEAMKKKEAMQRKRVICIILACVLLLGGISVGIIAYVPEAAADITADPAARWSYADADDVFEEAFDKFNALIADYVIAAAYYYDNNSTTAVEDIGSYEEMWQSLSNDAKAIQTALTEKAPPEEYEDAWNDFAACMGKISDLFASCDDEYTGAEMADWLQDIAYEFDELSHKSLDLAQDLAAISATIKTDYFFLQIYNSEDQVVSKYEVTLTGVVTDTSREITSVSFTLVSGDVCKTDYEIDGYGASVTITHPTEGYLMRIFTLGADGVFSAL